MEERRGGSVSILAHVRLLMRGPPCPTTGDKLGAKETEEDETGARRSDIVQSLQWRAVRLQPCCSLAYGVDVAPCE